MRQQRPEPRTLWEIFVKFEGYRIRYLLWVALGKIYLIERKMNRKNGFLRPPRSLWESGSTLTLGDTSTNSSVSISNLGKKTGDYRFRVLLPRGASNVKLEFFVERPLDMSFECAVSGKSIGVVSLASSGWIELHRANPPENLEVSISTVSDSCKACSAFLGEVPIKLSFE